MTSKFPASRTMNCFQTNPTAKTASYISPCPFANWSNEKKDSSPATKHSKRFHITIKFQRVVNGGILGEGERFTKQKTRSRHVLSNRRSRLQNHGNIKKIASRFTRKNKQPFYISCKKNQFTAHKKYHLPPSFHPRWLLSDIFLSISLGNEDAFIA